MANKDPNAQSKPKKPRAKATPKPVFIVIGGDCPVIGVFRKAEEVLKVLEENEGARYVKFMLSPAANSAE